MMKYLGDNLISDDFTERIMVAVTAVNGCIMCSWMHTKRAIESGCTDEEISEILCSDFQNIKKSEMIALTFAQYYAETEGEPSKKALKRLLKYYGKQKSLAIIGYIKMITVGNLLGNTIEAFEHRFKGNPPKNGSFLLELIIFLIGSPIYFFAKRSNKRNNIIISF
ncbi:MAG: carboxymuconolactone decarboxylase family protein [Promethearchaeota archaeon]